MPMPPTFDPLAITPGLAKRLLAVTHPHWAGLPIVPAKPQGWGSRAFRLGDA
ncbi:MAG TPA: hypothetical protein PLC98_25415 [Anaerolineales bacterium]|nr:hypothetical protein [Anaerolineales bacterium]